jgi:hypothetical protein
MAAAYGLAYYNRHWGHWPLPTLLSSYLADLLALPLLLTLALAFMRRWYFRQPAFVLPGTWVVATWASLAIWFEVLLPALRPLAATADPLDVLAYAVGGFIFWRWLNRPADG